MVYGDFFKYGAVIMSIKKKTKPSEKKRVP